MSWKNLYLIKLSPDKVIDESASTYRKYYSIPAAKRFVETGESHKTDSHWTRLASQSLSHITMADHLIIVAHGSVDRVGNAGPNGLANMLKSYGLEEAGLISFKCCHVGRQSFLEDFLKAADKSNIKIGWVKGYRGRAATEFGGLMKPREIVTHKNSLGYKFGSKRYKIVKGKHSHKVGFDGILKIVDDDEE
ncbi:MAG TPA: hypothetical protein VFM46_18450 [Pseudomonadales bacterium]|nr:hypothetical protein [Pseudomonadales bacterium]